MLNITILGSTGSIGASTLDVIARNKERFQIFALTANQNVDALFKQCLRFKPHFAVMRSVQAAEQLAQRLQASQLNIKVLAGEEGLIEVASHATVDCVVAAIVGAAGLLPTLAAAQTGKRILLANKEVLVMAGSLFMQAVRESGATLLPIDSEHNAIFQCLPHDFYPGRRYPGVKNIILTASGGPFRNLPLDQLETVSPEQACAHPNWEMGRKISVDSASMMNKGLEVIEAYWLFDMPIAAIQVVLHPQSIIHSLVEYEDGSMLAQLGNPDMRTPIAHALAWPDRINSGVSSLDLIKLNKLEFLPITDERYPCLSLALAALKIGGTAPTVLNATNEVAVQAFLDKKIRFTQIATLIESTLDAMNFIAMPSFEDILAADKIARIKAVEQLNYLQSVISVCK